MALKAGRVGVKSDQVDSTGRIIGGGGSVTGVKDVKVDGVSVVDSNDVANITLPEVPDDYVKDVKVDGVSVVTNGIANISQAAADGKTLVECSYDDDNVLFCIIKTNSVISGITSNTYHYSFAEDVTIDTETVSKVSRINRQFSESMKVGEHVLLASSTGVFSSGSHISSTNSAEIYELVLSVTSETSMNLKSVPINYDRYYDTTSQEYRYGWISGVYSTGGGINIYNNNKIDYIKFYKLSN